MAQTSSDNSNAAGIGAGVAVAVAVTLVVVIVAVLLIRRRRKMKEPNANVQKIDSSERFQHVSLSPVSGDKGTKPKAAIKPQVKHLDRQDQTAETHIYGNLSSTGQELDITVADSVYCNIQNSRNDVTSSSPSQDSANNVTRTAKTPDNKPRKPPVAAKPNAVVYENVQPRVKEASQSKSHDEENLALPVEDVPDEDSVYNHEDLYACYSSVSSTQSLMDSFQKYLLDCLASSGKLQEEFKKFPSGMPHPHDIGSQPANSGKNRFKKLCAYDKNRVILKRPKGDTDTDYINASYIQGFQIEKAYIATQGPRAHTVPDLWWMIWQEKSSQIIMLTNLKEDGKDKCNEYWPAVGKASVYGHVTVTSQKEDTRADFVIRTFILDVKEGGKKPREVQQYHYTAWPDHGVPAAGSLVNYWRYVTARASGAAPPVVHCSAGVGRTGTYIALDIAMDRKSRGLDVSVHGIVSNLREQRSIMVQTEVQYRFLHEVILEAYSSRDTRITVSQLDSRLPTDIDVKKANEVIDKEFKMLTEMKQWAKPHHTTAELEENRAKNRDPSVLPDDDHMAYLGIYARGRNQYINAVFLSSFTLRNGLLLTQLPLHDTAVDLWRLVEGCNVKTIVSLGGKEDSKNIKNYCQYWPQMIDDVLNFGPYSVSLRLAKSDGEYLRSYDLSVQSKGNKHSVRILHYTDWASDLPNNTAYMLHLLDTLKTLTGDTSPIIIQCVDGATRSGLFCVLFDVMNRMTHDEDVDVFTAVRDVHSVRPQAVRTETEYRYCYKLAQEVRQRKLYANS